MRQLVLLVALFAMSPVPGSTLFDNDSILEVTLSGPLTSLAKMKRDRKEYPFTLRMDGTSVGVSVRVRGNSRVVACHFPPLSLTFDVSEPNAARVAGNERLKLVTHCRNGERQSQDAVLNEFAAYRVFNLISDLSYRVRLLRIRYDDTDGKQRTLDQPHYGFLIESDQSLAERLGGEVEKAKGIRFGDLDTRQTARMTVFQYLIGNKDWSFVTADNDDTCCHNIDLLKLDQVLVPVPYDFDLAALTQADYPRRIKLNKSTHREYSGYCRTPVEALDKAIDHVQQLKDKIVDTVLQLPALEAGSRQRRARFVASYFEEAADKPALLARFDRKCIGSVHN